MSATPHQDVKQNPDSLNIGAEDVKSKATPQSEQSRGDEIDEKMEWLRHCKCDWPGHNGQPHLQEEVGCPSCDWCHGDSRALTNTELLAWAEKQRLDELDRVINAHAHLRTHVYLKERLAQLTHQTREDPVGGAPHEEQQ